MAGRGIEQTSLTVILRHRGSWTGGITRAETRTAIGSTTVRGGAFMAGQFSSCWSPGRQLKENPGIRRVSEVAMEPPLVEGIVGQGRHGSIIVWEGFHSDIKSPHSGGDDRYSHDKKV